MNKKNFLVWAAFLLFFSVFFSQVQFDESGKKELNFLMKVMGYSAAVEKVQLTETEDGFTFEANVNFNYNQVKSSYFAEGRVQEGLITEYCVEIDYNGKKTVIEAYKKDGELILIANGSEKSIPWEENFYIIDNNISSLWYFFYEFYKESGISIFKIVIPQLFLSSESPLFDLSVLNTTEREDSISHIIKFVNSQGVLKADISKELNYILIGGVTSERVE